MAAVDPPKRRLYPGSRIDAAFEWPLKNCSELDSIYAPREYLQQLIRTDRSNVNLLVETPEGIDPDVWQFQHLRQVCMELSLLVVELGPVCTKEKCPEMKADGWLYLCAAHRETQSCPAIDYIIHTLDGCNTLLNNSKYFDREISIRPESLKHFKHIARRLDRIFAHAYFHHREEYESFEMGTTLHKRFLKLLQKYKLTPSTLVTISGDESDADTQISESSSSSTVNTIITGSMIKPGSGTK